METGLHFEVLGSLRITVDGGEIPLRSRKQRSLLGALLTDPGSVVSADRLSRILWGDQQPDDPSGALQTHVSRLREVLGDGGRPAADRVLVTRPPGYALAVDRQHVDAGRFERLLDEARASPTPAATAALSQEALELWRGEAFAEFEHGLARAEATRLEELRATAVELRADALLAMGRYAQAAGELEAAVARDSSRERSHGQLMLALVGSGRRADALAVYRRLRDELVDQLGVEPSAHLRELERAILQQDEDLPWPAPAQVEGTGPGQGHAARGLPSPNAVGSEPLNSFVGRQADVRGVAAALSTARVVVVTGVGGVGKSRLAVRVARQSADDYADGVRTCDLVGTDDPEAVADLVATSLGVWTADGASTEDAILRFLGARRLLLVLDNCEHVLPGAAGLAERVARSCPGVDVLATSRQPLGIPSERIRPVGPLEGDDAGHAAAVRLFCDRAASADPSFALSEGNRAAVERICRRLDGLPLAIELAAARVRSMTCEDIADRLDDRFDLLVSDSPAATPRHRSLREVMAWSYAQLPLETRRLFGRLGVFAGGFGLASAEQVCADDRLTADEVPRRLGELVDHSIVSVDRSRPRTRYHLLETLRAYARTRLEESGDRSVRRLRHAEHFVGLSEDAGAGLRGPDEARWVRVIHTEFANLRTAHGWACSQGRADLALRLVAGLREHAYYQLSSEVYGWTRRALELRGAADQPAHPAALVTAAIGCVQRGRLSDARAHAERALSSGSEQEVRLHARRLLAEVALYRGRLDESERLARELVEQARTTGSRYDEAMGHLYRVHAAAYAGRTDDAVAHLEVGWQAAEAADNPTLRAGYHYLRGEVTLDADPVAALAQLQQAAGIARSVGNRFLEGVARVSSVSLAARHGEPYEALTAFPDLIGHWRASGDWTHLWTTLRNLVALLARVGAARPAAVLLGAIDTATAGAAAFGAAADRLEGVSASLRASLGEDAFAAAEARGRAMEDDEAVVHALDEIDRLLDAGAARHRR